MRYLFLVGLCACAKSVEAPIAEAPVVDVVAAVDAPVAVSPADAISPADVASPVTP